MNPRVEVAADLMRHVVSAITHLDEVRKKNEVCAACPWQLLEIAQDALFLARDGIDTWSRK